MQRNKSLSLATSFISLIGALVLSACGGGQTDLGTDGRAQPLDAGGAPPIAEAEVLEPSAATTIRSANVFEKPEWDGEFFDGLQNSIECEASIERSTAVSRSGESSVRFQTGLKNIKCPKGYYRTEVSVKTGEHAAKDYAWDDPNLNWVGLSIYPRKFDNPAFTLVQIHAPNEKKGSHCDYAGNAATIKPEMIDGKMHYAFYVILDGSKVRERNGAFSGTTRVWKEPMKMNAFTDFVFSFTLSTKKNGTVKLWRNGELVYSAAGLTNVNYIDSCGNPIADRKHRGPRAGIYGPPTEGTAKQLAKYGDPYRELFVDHLRTATGPDGYALVDPAR